MLSKEAGLNGGVHLLRLIREQIQVNKATYPEQYLQDEWKVRDSSINEYEEFFKPVTIKMGEAGIVGFIKNRSSRVVLDIMSSTSALRELSESVGGLDRAIVVSLRDTRCVAEKQKDEKLGIKIVTGDMLLSDTWKKIEKESKGRKFDLIMERGVGGLGFLSRSRDIPAALIRKAWKMLSNQEGMMLIQTMTALEREEMRWRYDYEDAGLIIEKWSRYLSERKIRVNYVGNLFLKGDLFGALKLIKTLDSPKELGLLPESLLSEDCLVSREEDEEVRQKVNALLKLLDDIE